MSVQTRADRREVEAETEQAEAEAGVVRDEPTDSPTADRGGRDLPRRRSGQPGQAVRRQPAQRRRDGGRRAGPPGRRLGSSATRRPPTSSSPGSPTSRVVLAKPRSYMNLSGGATASLARFFSIEPGHIIAVHDELDLPAGTIRVKSGGGEGGHNGLRSISVVPGHQGLPAGAVRHRPTARPDGPRGLRAPGLLGAAERKELDVDLEHAADAVELLIEFGLEATQNQLHARDPARSTRVAGAARACGPRRRRAVRSRGRAPRRRALQLAGRGLGQASDRQHRHHRRSHADGRGDRGPDVGGRSVRTRGLSPACRDSTASANDSRPPGVFQRTATALPARTPSTVSATRSTSVG